MLVYNVVMCDRIRSVTIFRESSVGIVAHRRFVGILFLFVALGTPLFGDFVVLKDGNRIDNVKVIYQAGRVNVVRRDGGIQSFETSAVDSVVRVPVRWDPGLSEAEFARRMSARIDEVVTRIQAEEEHRLQQHRAHLLGAGLRAAVWPGWSKMERGDFWYGAGVAAAALGGVAAVAISQARYAEAQARYDDLTLPLINFALFSNSPTPLDAYIPLNLVEFRQRRRRLNSEAQRLDLAIGVTALLWLVNWTEALIHANLNYVSVSGIWPANQQPSLSATMRRGVGDGLEIRITGRF